VTKGRLVGWATIEPVNPERMLAELCLAASRLGVDVRQHALRGGYPGAGGLCRIRGKSVVFMNSKAPAFERAAVLAQALAELGHGGESELSPECRAFVTRHAPRGTRVTPKPTDEGPGLASLGARGRRRSS
jgi:hypothetical protein